MARAPEYPPYPPFPPMPPYPPYPPYPMPGPSFGAPFCPPACPPTAGLAPSRRRGATSVRSIRLGFLGPSHFAANTPANECWIVLDFLGFSRQNRDFSMGYQP